MRTLLLILLLAVDGLHLSPAGHAERAARVRGAR